jgi:regulator of cell morphogenesis and NO signaling
MSILDQNLGQLARDIPGITAVFHKYQLDFCCGGKQSLRAAASKRDLDIDILQKELDALQLSAPDGEVWSGMSDTQLIEYILTRYHDVHREQLPELIRLAHRVERVHGNRADCPIGLTSHLESMCDELENHMLKEEQILFPMIIRGLQSAALHPVAVMRQEHDEHGEALAKIDLLTAGITPPDDACNTWCALYLGLQTLKTDLINHIHLENNILFNRIDGQLEDVRNG